MKARRIEVAIVVVLLAATTAAQAPPAGKLSGTVVDTSDKVMPGVSVGLRGPESRSTVTDKDGRFAFTSLTGGDYELWARLTGFATTVEKVTVTEKTEPVKIRMRVGREVPEVVFIYFRSTALRRSAKLLSVCRPDSNPSSASNFFVSALTSAAMRL